MGVSSFFSWCFGLCEVPAHKRLRARGNYNPQYAPHPVEIETSPGKRCTARVPEYSGLANLKSSKLQAVTTSAEKPSPPPMPLKSKKQKKRPRYRRFIPNPEYVPFSVAYAPGERRTASTPLNTKLAVPLKSTKRKFASKTMPTPPKTNKRVRPRTFYPKLECAQLPVEKLEELARVQSLQVSATLPAGVNLQSGVWDLINHQDASLSIKPSADGGVRRHERRERERKDERRR
ncbi:hypothetical protein FSARC_7398 [Fusarium sarcochroum]|uniref:Uncharacterized protein n=1 Tax=Fusarium sarcochroum TaxID=1208366 RepID=A0A8H4TV99_9HYPO|nr:hypothetical protein FSARC_7398 [Fusarium sarcochroum]